MKEPAAETRSKVHEQDMPAMSSISRLGSAWRRGRRILGYLIDLTAFILAGLVAFELRFDGGLPPQYLRLAGTAICIWAVAKSTAFVIGAVTWGHWRYTSVNDVARIVLANVLGSILGIAAIALLCGPRAVPRTVYILDWLMSCVLTLGVRLTVRLIVATHKVRRSG